jgi:hypothetical protein
VDRYALSNAIPKSNPASSLREEINVWTSELPDRMMQTGNIALDTSRVDWKTY